jgi:hypothetical protein
VSRRRRWALIAALLSGCEPPLPAPLALVTRTEVRPVSSSSSSATTYSPSLPWQTDAVVVDPPAILDRRVALVGVRLDDTAAVVAGTAWLLVVGELAGRTPELVVDVGGEQLLAPIAVALHPLEWRAGDVVAVDFAVSPKGRGVPIAIGMSDAGRTWPGGPIVIGARAADRFDASDGARAVKRRGPIVLDGALDEATWQQAPSFSLRPTQKGAVVTQSTTVRFVWDETALWVAFDVDDDDPHSLYRERDAPLYESEVLELFIDADGDHDVYVELQASPTDVVFDASFAGGSRRHMNLGYALPWTTATKARPQGYTQEWMIPVAGLLDVPPGEPRPGARWQINVFRLERRRRDGVVVSTEASALSPPPRPDFHALEALTTLVFAPEHAR